MYVKPGLGPLTPNPPKKALENRYRAEMHLHSPIFKDSSLKKIWPITLMHVEKCKRGVTDRTLLYGLKRNLTKNFKIVSGDWF